jgi:hypothetical protein
MTDSELRENINRSERTRRLLATMIQYAVSKVHNHQIDASTARDLARSHLLDTAITEIGLKLRTHQEIADRNIAFRLAVTEVAITGQVSNVKNADAVVAIRKKTLDTIRKHSQGDADLARDLGNVLAIRDDISRWASEWGKFMHEYRLLWNIRNRQAHELSLSPDQLKTALLELETVFVRYGTVFLNNRASPESAEGLLRYDMSRECMQEISLQSAGHYQDLSTAGSDTESPPASTGTHIDESERC